MAVNITTEAQLDALTIPDGKNSLKRVVFNAGRTGLTIKLQRNKSGSITKSWIAVDSRLPGKEKSLGGTYPKLSLEGARKRHKELMLDLENGVDITAPRVETPETLDALFDVYINSGHAPKSKLNGGYRAIWGKWCQRETRFGQTRCDQLTRTAIHQHLKAITNNGHENLNAARRIRDILCALIDRLSIDYGIEITPPATLQKIFGSTKAFERMNKKREVSLDADQLRTLWGILMSDRTRPAYLAMRWLICTCTRKSETVDARFDELVGDEWVIPAERTKTKQNELRVPICPMMRDVINDLAALERTRGFMFGIAANTLNHCCTGWREAVGVDFTVHDTRRTATTLTTQAGLLDAFEADLMLNHTPANTAILRNYNPDAFVPRVTAAIAVWQRYLEEVIS
ncbi:tyrosine-type recombinase/integrase [Enterobacter hormaechei]|nr:integrase arm-type DNA-binding domain-containing protein [Enterobacter hormaechei subsp. steigerwaltii]HAV1727717.1 integrase arm-type DNA-binding domain-containing protein [Enterobacter hormaechei subsp. steigerwaltii]HAV1855368.1 integrase arm-type DNA-binding domain-containing protein [Enterobacter hormaechei subsp. steigerwaltii]